MERILWQPLTVLMTLDPFYTFSEWNVMMCQRLVFRSDISKINIDHVLVLALFIQILYLVFLRFVQMFHKFRMHLTQMTLNYTQINKFLVVFKNIQQNYFNLKI